MAVVEAVDETGLTEFRQRQAGKWDAFARFTSRKPLGTICGIIVVLFIVIGDAVPFTVNSAANLAGLGKPLPYVVDILRDQTSFVYPYEQARARERLQGPSGKHWLGTDGIGRDVFSRLLYGARVAIFVSVGAVLISEIVAGIVGIATSYYGGNFDSIILRFVDIIQALPGLVLLITILGIFGASLWTMIIAISLTSVPGPTRLIRSQAIAVMSMPYIEAARALGGKDSSIMWRHVLPNVIPIMLLSSTVRLGGIVLTEASLSFLGYGLPPPFPSWGQMLSLEGREYMRAQPGLAIYPGLAIGLLVFSYNLFGDALRDVLDPRLRGSR